MRLSQLAARNGFYWWELDATWWMIRLMGALGLAWDIRPVPARVYQEATGSLRLSAEQNGLQ